MSLKLKLFIKVAKRRIKEGMPIDEVLSEWPNLSEDEKNTIREAVKNE